MKPKEKIKQADVALYAYLYCPGCGEQIMQLEPEDWNNADLATLDCPGCDRKVKRPNNPFKKSK